MSAIEMRAGRAWLPLATGERVPEVAESSILVLRGFESGESFAMGPHQFEADTQGRFEERLKGLERLRGQLGLIEVRRHSGTAAGEFTVVPDKISEPAFQTLRAALERTWAGLIFDPAGTSRLRGVLPAPADLWHAIEDPLRDIVAEPRSVIASGEGTRRIESVRRPWELTPGLVRASQLQRAGRSRVLVRDVATPENSLVAETLRRLAFYSPATP